MGAISRAIEGRRLLGGALYWVHGNHLGVPLVTTTSTGVTANPTGFTRVGFPGQTQTTSDLYYNRYRDYDSSLGRYIQADPIGLDGGDNPYAYAENNPITLTDPWGLAPGGPEKLGSGYTGRTDPFRNGRNNASGFEIHVFSPSGAEVGLYGPDGWIRKHGFKAPPDLPVCVENALRGKAIDILRRMGRIGAKGRQNIARKTIRQILSEGDGSWGGGGFTGGGGQFGGGGASGKW